jgi:hypothetical protein
MSEESGVSLGSSDTDSDKRKYDSLNDSDDGENDKEDVELPPYHIRVKKQPRYKLVYTGGDAITRVAKAVCESRRTGMPLNTNVFIPPSSSDLLHELSLRLLSTERLEMTMTMNAVVRECETIASRGTYLRSSNVGDLQRMLRVYDDYTLANVRRGAKIDERHRLALFLTRMKIINALAVLQKTYGEQNDPYVNDHYWRESRQINNLELSRWMYANKVCHQQMLVVDESIGRLHPQYVAGHIIQHCTVECYWQSLLSFAAMWPYLKMSGHVVRMFDEMRIRAAFFLSYREMAVEVDNGRGGGGEGDVFSLKKQMDLSRTKILGLNLNLFGLMDMNNPDAELRPTTMQSSTLLDNVDMVKITDNYIHVNLDFAEECDRLLHAMQLDLRRIAGLAHNTILSDDCLGCGDEFRITASNVAQFEALIHEQVNGTFRTQISEEFRELLFLFYEQPNELEAFREYHSYEVITAQNCIAQQRPRDYKLLCDRFTAEHSDVVWQKLRSQFDEPAYPIMCIIALGYYMQQALRGARILTYFADMCKSGGGLEPFAHIDERAKANRKVASELHVKMTTTGTFLFRNKLVHQAGMLAEAEEIEYEHPLIIRSLNSIAVYYNGHLHRCQNFAHAFLLWLHIMCTDPCIEGQLATGAFLHELFARMFPERERAIRELSERAEERLRRYNPLSKFVDPAIAEAKEKLERNDMTQF